MTSKSTERYDPNVLRDSDLSDSIILQNYPNIWKPLIKKMKERGELRPDYSFINNTRVLLWLTGKDPNTGESVNRLLLNEMCEEYFDSYKICLSVKPQGMIYRMELKSMKWKKKPDVGYLLSFNYLGTWMGEFDMTANSPKQPEQK